MFNNQNKIIIFFLVLIPILTNGIFLAACDPDPVLEWINRLGDWGTAGLWKSSGIFAMYAFADFCYNIRYITSKVTYSLFPIKWADKLNGIFGFSSRGILEEHVAEEKYFPLYKDANAVFQNNIWQPFVSYTGLKPTIIYRDRLGETPVITAQNAETQIVERDLIKFVPALTQNELDSINVLAMQARNLNRTLTKGTEIIETQIGDASGHIPLSFLNPFFEMSYYKDLVRRDTVGNRFTPYVLLRDLRGNQAENFVIEELYLCNRATTPDFPGKPETPYFFKVSGRLEQEIQLGINRKRLSLNPSEQKDLGFCFYTIPLDEALLEDTRCLHFIDFLNQNPEVVPTLTVQRSNNGNVDSIFFDAYTNEEAGKFWGTYENLVRESQVGKEIVESLTLNYGSVAAVAALTVLPWQELLHSINLLNSGIAFFHNPEINQLLIQTLISKGHAIPDFLQEASDNAARATSTLSNPQDVASVQVPINAAQSFSSIPLWQFLVGTVVVCGVGYATYWGLKNGIDTTELKETAKTYHDILRDKYLKF